MSAPSTSPSVHSASVPAWSSRTHMTVTSSCADARSRTLGPVDAPSALFALMRDHDASGDDFSSLRLCRAAGDTVSAELEREFTELSGFPIDEAYGLTETGLVTVSPPRANRPRLGRAGSSRCVALGA